MDYLHRALREVLNGKPTFYITVLCSLHVLGSVSGRKARQGNQGRHARLDSLTWISGLILVSCTSNRGILRLDKNGPSPAPWGGWTCLYAEFEQGAMLELEGVETCHSFG